jgi:myo-inositol 2-dehydrogenase/D-chiro-inositol 1-dehydrogenase
MTERVKLGLIGCGSIARSAHLPAMASLVDRVELVATADVDAGAAEAAAKPWGATHSTDYRAVLARKEIEAVVVATPEYLHCEQVEAAAAAGKHILCEKPMAQSVAEADRMIAAAARAGVHLLIGHSRRFTRRYMEIRAAIDRGEIGAVRLMRENERRPRMKTGEQVWWTPKHWTGNPNVSQGVAMLNAIHEADLLRWCIGAEAKSVYAELAVSIPGNVGVPDFLSLTVNFTNGAIGSAEVSNCAPPGYPAFHQMELYGSEGAIRAKDHELIGLTRFTESGADFPGTFDMLLHNKAAYVRELAELVAAMRERRPVCMPPTEARAALALALAAQDSARTHRVVELGAMA